MSHKPQYQCQEGSISTKRQIPNDEDEKQPQKKPQNNDNVQKKNMFLFYFLLLIQAIIILVSYYVQMDEWFFDKTLGAESNSAQFQEYCQNTEYCQKKIDQGKQRNEIYQIWNYWPNQFHLLSLIAYPLFLIFQQSIRSIIFLRKIAFLFTIILYPCLFLFTQIILIYIRNYFEYYLEYIQLVFWIYLANIVFFMINNSISTIQNKQNEKITYLTFLAFIINVIYNKMSQTSNNWTFYILATVYILTYFIHIDSNLFKDNKYIKENKMLIRIILDKLLQPFQVEDVYQNLLRQHIVLNKNYTVFYVLIAILVYFLLQICQLQYIFIIIISIIFIFVLWDTSLVSTSVKFNIKDQWVTTNLFILDFLLPIRNIVILLLLD
ncbi:unnamed protein product [Paramecium primaurelia]|uniref:Transmembrane protein n=1 Tax=Paramecium primaurelia TaxID=5886 RepID=A0A8S1MKI2_PARPR|nr:unnamed protein product [Paramecium primaurelia]